ncbi:MAG: hypothetical protein JXR89_10035 [Deltaproteobacteria bacterium]|nr:hypothetical protein [Deltaproteobacteria bacterium]
MARSLKLLILVFWGVCCLNLGGEPCLAQTWELTRGRVLSLVETPPIVHLKIALNAGSGASTAPTGPDRKSTDSGLIELDIPAGELPASLKPGDDIRIWEKADPNGRILRLSRACHHDATGVRSRLGGKGRIRGGRGHGGKGGGR